MEDTAQKSTHYKTDHGPVKQLYPTAALVCAHEEIHTSRKGTEGS